MEKDSRGVGRMEKPEITIDLDLGTVSAITACSMRMATPPNRVPFSPPKRPCGAISNASRRCVSPLNAEPVHPGSAACLSSWGTR